MYVRKFPASSAICRLNTINVFMTAGGAPATEKHRLIQ